MHGGLLFQILIYLVAACLAVPLMKALGLGSVLGFLVAGIMIGPSVFNLVGSQEEVMHFAEFGVVIMLFLVGLELQPSKLWRLRASILGLGGLQVGVTTVVVTGCLLVMQLEWNQALALGLIFALSSTAIVLQTLQEKGLLTTDVGQKSFATLLFQDLAVIPMLSVFPLLSSFHKNTGASEGGGIVDAFLIVVAVLAIVFIGRFLSRPVFRVIASTRMREIFTAAAMIIVIGSAVAMEAVGLSAALGTFLAGVVLAESEYRHEIEATIDPFKALLLGLFFIAIGAGIELELIYNEFSNILGAVIGIMVVKFAVLFVLAKRFRLDRRQSLFYGVMLCQAGEFGFVLLAFASQQNILPASMVSFATCIVALSMLMTPLLVVFYDKFVRSDHESYEGGAENEDIESSEVIIAGYGRFGQIVSRLLRANGFRTTLLDHSPKHIERVRKFGIKVFYGDASRLDLLETAGAANARLLVIAIDDPEKTLELVDNVREHFPNLRILARASDRQHAFELIARGVDDVYRETFDSALGAGVASLKALGFRSHQAFRHGQIFKEHDEASLRELYKLYKESSNSPEFIAEARRRADDIQRILEADRQDRGDLAVDHAFDTPKPVTS